MLRCVVLCCVVLCCVVLCCVTRGPIETCYVTRGPIETFYSNCGSTLTTTDHVLTKVDTLASINDSHVQADHPDNLSFHLPIHSVLNQETLRSLLGATCSAKEKLSWKKISDEKVRAKYQACLERK